MVNSLEEAIDHISTYSSGHSEAILTENYTNSQKFLAQVDAAAVYVNASTRFTDGGEFGFGRRSASPPRNFTPEGRWASPN